MPNEGLTLHKKYELILVVRDPNNEMKFLSRDTVVSDDIIHLLAQFLIFLTQVAQRETKREFRKDDDIPF